MQKFMFVGLGGFIGASLRYYLSGIIQPLSFSFPISTLAINILGSFLLGVLMFSSEHTQLLDPNIRLFLTIGLLGAFTTMSAFSYESFKLLEQNQHFLFISNVLISILGVIFAVYLAKSASLYLWGG